jgi:hypothetical protein
VVESNLAWAPAKKASAYLVATSATAVTSASTMIPTSAVIATAMTSATVTTVKTFRVAIPEMANAEVLPVEILSPVVGTFITGPVVVPCASCKKQGYCCGADHQEFLACFHRAVCLGFLDSRRHGCPILKSASRSNSCFC